MSAVLEQEPGKASRMLEAIRALPQASQIEEANARAWVDSVLDIDPERADWHLKRCNFIGGSRIGALVAAHMGMYSMTQPHEIARDLLLQDPIQPPNSHMRRGIDMEPLVRKRFREEYGATGREDLIEAVQNASSEHHPWMGGNPDDIVEINGRLWMVDYKAAGEAPHDPPVEYAAQVHYYDYLLACHLGMEPDFPADVPPDRDRPLAVDGMIICYLDYRHWCTAAFEIPFNPEVFKAMRVAGDYAWRCILEGEYPTFERFDRGRLELDDENLFKLDNLNDCYLGTRIAKTIADGQCEQAKEELVEFLESLRPPNDPRLKGLSIPTHDTTISVRQKVDEEAFENLCHDNRLDPRQFMREGKGYDADRLAEAWAREHPETDMSVFAKQEYDLDAITEYCESHGLRVPVTETLIPQLSRRKKSIERLQPPKDEAKEALRRVYEDLGVYFPGILSDTSGDPSPEDEEGAPTPSS